MSSYWNSTGHRWAEPQDGRGWEDSEFGEQPADPLRLREISFYCVQPLKLGVVCYIAGGLP